MKLNVLVVEKYGHDGKWTTLSREVLWPVVPPKNETIYLGKEIDGKASEINATVDRIDFSSDGVTVEASILDCEEDYQMVIQCLNRDGFGDPLQ